MPTLMPRLLAPTLSLVAVCLVLGAAQAAVAPATATAGSPIALPETPEPSLCTVAPRPVSFFAPLVGTPAAGTPPAGFRRVASVADLPPGRPADAATVTAILAVVREATACANAGDPLRAFALTTARFARTRFAQGLSPQDFAILATPMPVPAAQRTVLLAVHDVRVFADGRVGAVIDLAGPRGHLTFFDIFVNQGGRWLDDDRVVVAAPPGTPPA
jgi:hypothetical protein